MINTPFILIATIFLITGVYFAGKFNLLDKLFNFLKQLASKIKQRTSLQKPKAFPASSSETINIELNLSLNFLKNKPKLKLIFLGILVLLILYLGISKFQFKKTCNPLTPLALSQYEKVSGVKPLLGEKCNLSPKSFLIKLLFADSQKAQTAKIGLVGGTRGERRNIAGYDWVTEGGNSSIFIVDKEKLGILVLLGQNNEAKIASKLKEVLKDEWTAESENLTIPKDIKPEEPAISFDSELSPTPFSKSSLPSDTSEKEEILEEARRYIRMHGEVIKFDVKITKKLDNYALVQVVPEENIEGAAVILEKIEGRWVAQDMGTAFPEWEEKVPELFKW